MLQSSVLKIIVAHLSIKFVGILLHSLFSLKKMLFLFVKAFIKSIIIISSSFNLENNHLKNEII